MMATSGAPKVVILGDVGVGKRSLFLRFRDNEFVHDLDRMPRHNEECYKEWTVGQQLVKVGITVFGYMMLLWYSLRRRRALFTAKNCFITLGIC